MKNFTLLFFIIACWNFRAYAYPPNEFSIDWSTVSTTNNVSRNLNSPYIGMCVCDKTYGLCDPNCCCDPDCDSDAKSFFTECLLQQSGYPPLKKCIEQNPATELKRVNVKNVIKIPGSGGAVCILRTNHPTDIFKYFSVPTEVSNPTSSENTVTQNSTLQIGQLLELLKYVEIDGGKVYRNFGILTIPTQTSHGICSRTSKPVPFMNPVEKVSCVMNGAGLCDQFSVQSFQNMFVDSNSNFAPITSYIYDVSGTLLETVPATTSGSMVTSYTEGIYCKNAVSAVRTVIEYNTTGIMQGAHYITVEDTPLKVFHPITFETAFVTDGESLPVNIISGTPGYVTGNRVRGGTLVPNGDKKAIAERQNGFSVPSGGRNCEIMNFQTVRLDHNIISSGCSLTISEEVMKNICATGSESTVLDILGKSSGSIVDYVARTNDALTNDTLSWVEVEGLSQTDTPGEYDTIRRRCDNISIGVQYTIVTANAGVVFNPQTVIVGVFADFIRGSFVIRNTTDFSSQAASTQHLIFKVSFASAGKQKLLSKKIDPPPVLPRVSSDVFYPF